MRADGAFEALVDSQLFHRAREVVRARQRRYSDGEMLEHLEHLYRRRGYLSGLIIDEAGNMPSSGMYQRRFGNLVRAYGLVGFIPDRDYRYIEVNRELRRLHREAVSDAIKSIEDLGGIRHPGCSHRTS